MITQLINGFVDFLNSLFSLGLLFLFLKFMLWYLFRINIKLPRFRNARTSRVAIRAKRYNKADYEFRKFKYETKLKYRNEYKLERLKLRTSQKENSKKSSNIASLPSYLKIIK